MTLNPVFKTFFCTVQLFERSSFTLSVPQNCPPSYQRSVSNGSKLSFTQPEKDGNFAICFVLREGVTQYGPSVVRLVQNYLSCLK
jgi:hypothetical protein